MQDLVVGVDLGGTKILTALAGRDGQVLARVQLSTEASLGRDHVIARIVESVRHVQQEAGAPHDAVKAVGVGAPGPLDPASGFVYMAPNLDWRDVPLGGLLRDQLGLPVYVDNDANLAALGEHVYGAGRGTGDMVYITVSTGVGGGLILGDHIYHGAGGGAGELGHITVTEDGPLCGCGNPGCLEAMASGTAMARRAAALVGEGRGAGILTAAGGNREKISARVVAQAAASGDPEALVIIKDAGRYLGIAVAGLINVFNPAAVVLGGGALQVGPALWEAMIEEVRRRAMEPALKTVRIVRAELGNDAGVMGAVALATEHCSW